MVDIFKIFMEGNAPDRFIVYDSEKQTTAGKVMADILDYAPMNLYSARGKEVTQTIESFLRQRAATETCLNPDKVEYITAYKRGADL